MASDYRVRLLQTILEETWVTVKADTPSEAESKALDLVLQSTDEGEPPSWHFVDCVGDIEIEQVMEITTERTSP
jgi:hypothetical protein